MLGSLPPPGAPASLSLEGEPHLPCPACGAGLEERRATRGSQLLLDLCPGCRGVLLDRGELPRLEALAKAGSQEARRGAQANAAASVHSEYASAVASMARAQAERGLEALGPSPPGAARAVAMAIGLPVDEEHSGPHPPLVSWLLLLALGVTFAFQLAREGGLIEYALVPSAFLRGQAWSTILTSAFLHGGVAHLFGNAWILWVVGDNVEGRLGHLWFAVLFLASALVANLAVLATDPQGTTPYVGASGAIAGLMGAYMVMFPRSRIWLRTGWRAGLQPLALPAVAYLLFWLGLQFLGVFAGQHGIAFWAHIGGFAAGLVAGFFARSAARV